MGVLLFPVLILSFWNPVEALASSPEPTPTPDRLAKPTLPAEPNQADLGAIDYWFSCMVCHGDRGQGLTEEWRAASGPEDMNCWQSRCHASNHPPEGFELPLYAPRLIGPGALGRFETAADLHDFIATEMPWQMPGNLDQDTYWRMTAFLLRENDSISGQIELGPDNAAQVWLREPPANIDPDATTSADKAGQLSPSATLADVQPANEDANQGLPLSVLIIVFCGISIINLIHYLDDDPGAFPA